MILESRCSVRLKKLKIEINKLNLNFKIELNYPFYADYKFRVKILHFFILIVIPNFIYLGKNISCFDL